MMASHAKESPTLNTLPSDILIHIFSFLRAKDILALRLTCKSLESATRERIVWLEAVSRMCGENVLYVPSFKPQNMSQRELEYLSMGSHRFHRLVQTTLATASEATDLDVDEEESIIPASAASERPLLDFAHFRMYSIARDPESLIRMHLVPGGRFIVTLHYRQGLEIRDLFAATGNTFEPCVIIEDRDIIYFTIHPAPDPDILRLRLRYTDGRDDKQERVLLRTKFVDVDLSVDGPVVRKTGGLDVPIPLEYDSIWTSVNGDIFVLIAGTQITVWNCFTDKCAQWIVPVGTSQFFITDTKIIIVSPYHYGEDERVTGLHIYHMPPLTIPSEHLAAYESKHVQPDFVVPFPSDIRSYLQCRGSCDWYTGRTGVIWLDLIHSHPNPTNPAFTRVKLVANVDGTFGVELISQCKLAYAMDGAFQSRQRMYDCDQKTLTWWHADNRNRGTVSCHFGDTIPRGLAQIHEDTESVALIRHQYGILQDDSWTSVCAVSGRLAFCSARFEFGGPMLPLETKMELDIAVVDYLSQVSHST